jgi:hypothetical protein
VADVLTAAVSMDTTPGAGSRAATALVSASATSSVRRCSARAKPGVPWPGSTPTA